MSDYFDKQLNPAHRPPGAPHPVPDDPDAEHADDEIVSPTPPSADPAPGTPASLKAAVQELLKYGLVEKEAKPNLYRTLLQEQVAAGAILEPFDLQLALDETRGLVFLTILASAAESADEAWQHPLVRRLRLTNEQSLLVAILRQAYIAYEQTHGIGAGGARADLDDLQAQLDLYLGDSGSESRNSDRLSRLITQLHAHGIVSEPDKENQVRIRPIIVHLANPEHLELLLHHFQKVGERHPALSRPDEADEAEVETEEE